LEKYKIDIKNANQMTEKYNEERWLNKISFIVVSISKENKIKTLKNSIKPFF